MAQVVSDLKPSVVRSALIFGALGLPHGVYLGFVAVTMPYLLSHAGVPVDRISQIVTLISLPWLVFFLWSPLVDTGIRRRSWLMLGAFFAGLMSAAVILIADTAPVGRLVALAIVGSVAASVVFAATGGLTITTLPASDRGRAAGAYEAGKLGGTALGGAAIVWLTRHLHAACLVAAVTLTISLPSCYALTVGEPSDRVSFALKHHLLEIFRTFRGLYKSPSNRWSALLLASPIGTGAAMTLLPALAKEYGVGPASVIWVNGIGSGLALALGATCGAWMPYTWNRQATYLSAGVFNAMSAVLLFAWPRPGIYLIGTLLYAASTGLCWARFAALAVSIIPSDTSSASTRYSVVIAIGNIPLFYMLLIDGFAAKHAGPLGVMFIESVGTLGVVGSALALFFFRYRVPYLSKLSG